MPTDAGPWAPYAPSADDPWDLRKVGHLHRRAGFGATWAELKRDLAAGPALSVARLLDPPAPAEETKVFEVLCRAAIAAADLDRLKTAWLYRVVLGGDPLQEKLTLLWHGYFATSVVKVRWLAPMYRQNVLLRQHALGSFAALLTAMVVDPAMLIWLDGSGNRKKKPNENFAREFLELFTVGSGHFTESDVREAARAFTGWIAVSGDPREVAEAARFDRDRFDDGLKTILGQTGRWGHAELVRIALEQPTAAEHLWSNDIVWGNPALGIAQFDPLAWAARHGIAPNRLVDAIVDLLSQGDLGADTLALIRMAGQVRRPDGLRQGLQYLLNCPEYQLA